MTDEDEDGVWGNSAYTDKVAAFMVEHPNAMAALDGVALRYGHEMQMHLIEPEDLRRMEQVEATHPFKVNDLLLLTEGGEPIGHIEPDGTIHLVDEGDENQE